MPNSVYGSKRRLVQDKFHEAIYEQNSLQNPIGWQAFRELRLLPHRGSRREQ
jgi:hypothetical protein